MLIHPLDFFRLIFYLIMPNIPLPPQHTASSNIPDPNSSPETSTSLLFLLLLTLKG